MDILISGKVQGVGFRYSCKKTADLFQIKGTVVNCDDGDVFIEAEGLPGNIEKFIQWCQKGPSMAHVISVKYTQTTIKGFHDFTILH